MYIHYNSTLLLIRHIRLCIIRILSFFNYHLYLITIILKAPHQEEHTHHYHCNKAHRCSNSSFEFVSFFHTTHLQQINDTTFYLIFQVKENAGSQNNRLHLISHNYGNIASTSFFFFYNDLSINFLFKLNNMRNYSHKPLTLSKR